MSLVLVAVACAYLADHRGGLAAGLELSQRRVRIRSGGLGNFDVFGQNTSALDAINPSDIESIEVVKGPAAATLYGTEAAAGVIQIFTKRGVSGAPRWNLQVDQGFNRLLPFAPDVDVRPVNDPLVEGPRGTYSYKLVEFLPNY